MKFNIFEGSRRIALMFAGLVVVASQFFIFTSKPFITTNYYEDFPKKPIQIKTDCLPDAAVKSFYRSFESGKSAYVRICLKPLTHDDGQTFLFAYMHDPENNKYALAAEDYSPEIEAYKEKLESEFTFSSSEIDTLKKEYRSEMIKLILQGYGYLIGGLILFYLLVTAIGWIVRGFLGIPRGKDKLSDAIE
jgi:hypothetical protein